MVALHIGPLAYNPYNHLAYNSVQPLGFMHLISSLSIFGVCTSVKLNTKEPGLIPDSGQVTLVCGFHTT